MKGELLKRPGGKVGDPIGCRLRLSNTPPRYFQMGGRKWGLGENTEVKAIWLSEWKTRIFFKSGV